jgi:Flp pilus assembly protein TadB
MTDTGVSRLPHFLLAVCAGLICFGILTVAWSSGFFMNLLGASILAAGGSAAYLILSNRNDRMKRFPQANPAANQPS